MGTILTKLSLCCHICYGSNHHSSMRGENMCINPGMLHVPQPLNPLSSRHRELCSSVHCQALLLQQEHALSLTLSGPWIATPHCQLSPSLTSPLSNAVLNHTSLTPQIQIYTALTRHACILEIHYICLCTRKYLIS